MSWNDLLHTIRGVLGFELFELAGTPVSLATLLTLVGVLLVFLWLSWVLRRGLTAFMNRRQVSDQGTVAVIGRLLHYSLLVVGLSIGLHTIGVNLSALFAAGALFAVALGFAMQNVVGNFVSGVILLVERVIKPGDVLEVEGQMVRVLDLAIRATVVRTLDDEDLVIPNSVLVQSTVKNYTLRDPLYRVRVVVGVTYGSDMGAVRRILESVGAAVEGRSPDREPVVLLIDFGSSSVDWELSVWIGDPWQQRRVRSEVREAIWKAFQAEGVTIAFPQLDVHFDREALAALGKEGS